MPPWRLQPRRNTFTRTCSAAAFKTSRTRGAQPVSKVCFFLMCVGVGAHKKGEVEIWSQSVRLHACVFLAQGTLQNVPDSSLDRTAALPRFFFRITLCQVEEKILDVFPVSLVSSNLNLGERRIQKLHHATSRKMPFEDGRSRCENGNHDINN